MNINELANMTSTPKDTIRLYREKGLLHPAKNTHNNYFIYHLKDLCTLLFVKKMRFFQMPISNIRELLRGSDPHNFISEYDTQIASLKEEQKKIQIQINHLCTAKEFLENTLYEEGHVYEVNFTETRYDIYPDLLSSKDQDVYQKCLLILRSISILCT